jgi:tellurite methyltransferase
MNNNDSISTDYWSNTYKTKRGDSDIIQEPSTFAKYCKKYLPSGSGYIVDIGCGNGRDSLYFKENGHNVFLVDRSIEALDLIEVPNNNKTKIVKQELDLTQVDKFDLTVPAKCFYSRFSLHSLNQETQTKVLKWIAKYLILDGMVCIETRSKKDSKFGIGIKVDDDSYIGTHYRRFQTTESLSEELVGLGFSIVYTSECVIKGATKEEDANVIRIIASKN